MTIIAYDNKLAAALFTDVLGATVNNGFNLARWNDTRYPTTLAPVGGAYTVEADLGAAFPCSTFILGAHQYAQSGARFVGGTVSVQYWSGVAWVVALAATAINALPTQTAAFSFTAMTAQRWRFIFTGLPVGQPLIPEMFLGDAIQFVNPEYGQDLSKPTAKINRLDTEAGRIYESRYYQRVEIHPSWSQLTVTEASALIAFRAFYSKLRIPFWITTIDGLETLLMREKSNSIPITQQSPIHYTASLMLVEAI